MWLSWNFNELACYIMTLYWHYIQFFSGMYSLDSCVRYKKEQARINKHKKYNTTFAQIIDDDVFYNIHFCGNALNMGAIWKMKIWLMNSPEKWNPEMFADHQSIWCWFHSCTGSNCKSNTRSRKSICHPIQPREIGEL